MENGHRLETMLASIARIQTDLFAYHPKALLLFGSMARYLAGGGGNHLPNDVDLLTVTGNTPFEMMKKDYGCRVELHCMTVERMVGIARSLRYDSRPAALAKLYGRVLVRSHAIDVIAAAMLLGPAYPTFGIEQIEIDGRTDTRDYSIHRILLGEAWWQRLCRYAAERRGPLKRLSDKIAHCDRFDG